MTTLGQTLRINYWDVFRVTGCWCCSVQLPEVVSMFKGTLKIHDGHVAPGLDGTMAGRMAST